MAKYLSGSKLQNSLLTRTEIYSAGVGAIYRGYLQKVIDLVKGTELEEGKPFSFFEYGYGDDATKIFRQMYSSVYQFVRSGMEKEWIIANNNNDELVKSIFGEKSIDNNHFAKYFKRNMEAMDALFARKSKDEGLDLSQRIWKYTGSYRYELENVLDLAMGEGTGANALAGKIQKYLNEPDRFYRRFRIKTGEDEAGNPIYGRVWKRRMYDKETGSYTWIDDNPKYKPGQGIYRSSVRNAQRLVRTETNIAYRTANYERWQQLDFVVGVEIKRSNNPFPCVVCESMKGAYPKDFKWTGWHPNCRCHMIPILAKQDEVDNIVESILKGEDETITDSVNAVKDYPSDFQQWLKDNEERMKIAKATGKLPYFIKDNISLLNQNSIKQGDELMFDFGNLYEGKIVSIDRNGILEKLTELNKTGTHEESFSVLANKQVYWKRSGDKGSIISFTDAECGLMNGAELYHNHPENGIQPLSDADIKFMLKHGLKSIHAIGANGVHYKASITKGTRIDLLPEFEEISKRAWDKMYAHYSEKDSKAWDKLRLNMQHYYMISLSKELKFRYSLFDLSVKM